MKIHSALDAGGGSALLKWRAFRAWIGSRLKPSGESRLKDRRFHSLQDGGGRGDQIRRGGDSIGNRQRLRTKPESTTSLH
jgi:hypothetical protein